MNDLKNVQVDENIALGDFETNPRKWLTERAREIGATYFWGYAENGALWGRFDDAGLKLAGDVFPEFQIALAPKTICDGQTLQQARTLQQTRVFGENAELFVWHDGETWRGRVIRDLEGEIDSFERDYWLWGTPHVDKNTKKIVAQDGFTLFVEGAQGMRHAPPCDDFKIGQRAAVRVKHYVKYAPEEREAVVGLSRLVGVKGLEEE